MLYITRQIWNLLRPCFSVMFRDIPFFLAFSYCQTEYLHVEKKHLEISTETFFIRLWKLPKSDLRLGNFYVSRPGSCKISRNIPLFWQFRDLLFSSDSDQLEEISVVRLLVALTSNGSSPNSLEQKFFYFLPKREFKLQFSTIFVHDGFAHLLVVLGKK